MATNTESQIDLVLKVDKISPGIRTIEYAVNGPISIRANLLGKELAKGVKKPFTEVIFANRGDAHYLGQKPITFIRQVLSLIAYPNLLNSNEFPDDAKDRARALLQANGGSTGSYSPAKGLEIVRTHVAQYIERRDGFPSNPNDIYLYDGVKQCIQNIFPIFSTTNESRTGILVPCPQYPLYSTIAEYNLEKVFYYLNEDDNWSLDVNELERAIKEGRKHCNIRAIVVINPGNPTGQVLTRDNIVEVIKFAHREKLFIFTDEVYQDNIYAEDREFHSFKKVAAELGHPYNKLELASLMSCSKGYMGECGARGGYMEIVNIDPEVKKILEKYVAIRNTPNVFGQAVLECIVNPPQPDEPSYELFMKEKEAILKSLAKRAEMITTLFNLVPGVKCSRVQGAIYAFPKVDLPEKAVAKAKSLGQEPNLFYTFQLLEETGICFVPGSGFGQKPGTYHFRTTILPQIDKLEMMVEKFSAFHEKFLKEYQ